MQGIVQCIIIRVVSLSERLTILGCQHREAECPVSFLPPLFSSFIFSTESPTKEDSVNATVNARMKVLGDVFICWTLQGVCSRGGLYSMGALKLFWELAIFHLKLFYQWATF